MQFCFICYNFTSSWFFFFSMFIFLPRPIARYRNVKFGIEFFKLRLVKVSMCSLLFKDLLTLENRKKVCKLYVCLWTCLYVCVSVCMSVSLFVCLWVCLYACVSVCTSVHAFVFVCIPACPFVSICVRLYICKSIGMPFHLSFYQHAEVSKPCLHLLISL
jgi:hypothetical protein